MANLALSDIILSLTSSLSTPTRHISETTVTSNHVQRHINCRFAQAIFTTIMANSLIAVVMLTADRFINIHHAMRFKIEYFQTSNLPIMYHFYRYNVIMKRNKGWWMIFLSWIFCLCVGSLVFTVTDLKKNHECTWAFTIAKEIQLSTTALTLLVFLAVFCFYGVILSKYYKRKRKFDSFRQSLEGEAPHKYKDINFSKRSIHFLPLKKSIKDPNGNEDQNVQLKHMKSLSENGDILKIDLTPISRIGQRKSSNLSQQLSFHVSYLKSSNYVLVTLFSFWMFHSPLFVYQNVELFK